jgi:hypothetical protein
MLTPKINRELMTALRRFGLLVSLESEWGIEQALIRVEYAHGRWETLLKQRHGRIYCPLGGGRYMPTTEGVLAWLRNPTVRMMLHGLRWLAQKQCPDYESRVAEANLS